MRANLPSCCLAGLWADMPVVAGSGLSSCEDTSCASMAARPTGRRPRAGAVGAACSAAMSPEPPRSHFVPRTREGRLATAAFVALFLLAMPPVTHALWDRPDRWIAGWPFFFVVLFLVYSALVGVLVWTLRKDV